MRLPNSYGSITKLKGNRRRPYMVRITTEWYFNEETMKFKQIQKVLGYYRTRSEAITALSEYNNNPYDIDTLKITFDEIYKRLTFPESNIRNYSNAYKYLTPLKDKPIADIRAGHMQDCIDSCDNTMQRFIKSICTRVFKYANKNELTTRDPSQYLTYKTYKTQIDRQVYDHQQVTELWEISENWWATFTLIMLYTGLRAKELKNVPLENIDLENRWLQLAQAKNECSVRGIPIHKRILPLFERYIENGGNMYGYSHTYLNDCLKDFRGHTAHDARHSFATRMRELGTDQLVIKRLLGHTPTDITERVYTHLTQEELTEAVDKLEY